MQLLSEDIPFVITTYRLLFVFGIVINQTMGTESRRKVAQSSQSKYCITTKVLKIFNN